MKRTLSGCVLALSIAAMLSVFVALPAAAQDDSKQPSDRVVDFLKTFVVGFLIPEELERSDGTKIKIDRSDPEEMKKFEIPREDMRRIIRIAYNGATAEICDRMDLQEAGFAWMQLSEINKDKWSDHQLFFISRLYLATIMWQTGKATVETTTVAKDGKAADAGAAQAAQDEKVPLPECTDARRKQVEKFEAFLKTQSG